MSERELMEKEQQVQVFKL